MFVNQRINKRACLADLIGNGRRVPDMGPFPRRDLEEVWNYFGIKSKAPADVRNLLKRFWVPEGDPIYCGMEVEVENILAMALLNNDNLRVGWSAKDDRSLRNGVEFISHPYSGEDLVWALVSLRMWMDTALRAPPSFSWRTSTHVHLNVRDLTLEELAKLILLYVVFEQSLFSFSDVNRTASVFCVPIANTPAAWNIRHFLESGDMQYVCRDFGWAKYGALNINRIWDIGTVEYRHMSGGLDLPKLLIWLSFIMAMHKAARAMSVKDLMSYIHDLNTTSNYMEFQIAVFGRELAEVLAKPVNTALMLSNGVTFAKMCMPMNENVLKMTRGSAMWQFWNQQPRSNKAEDEGIMEDVLNKKAIRPMWGAAVPPPRPQQRRRPARPAEEQILERFINPFEVQVPADAWHAAFGIDDEQR